MSHKPNKPIFNGDQPRFPIKQPGANLAMASGIVNMGPTQGRSVSLANQIKKAELDLLSKFIKIRRKLILSIFIFQKKKFNQSTKKII